MATSATSNELACDRVPLERLPSAARIALFIFCLISIGISLHQSFYYFSHGPVYSDFRIFTTGIAVMRSGQAHQMYQFPVQKKAQEKLYPEARVGGLLPFNHLAYELLLYWPFALLSYNAAIRAWAVLNVGIVILIGWLLKPYTQSITQRVGLPIALLLFAFYPVIYVLGEGQDSLVFLLLVVLSLRSMDRGQTFLAGVLLGLACFKLHLAFLLGFFILALGRKWKGIAGFAAGAAFVTAISMLMVGKDFFPDYVLMLRKQEIMTPWGFIPWFMPNLRGIIRFLFWRSLEPGQVLPIIFMASVIVAVFAAWLVVRARVPRDSGLLYSTGILTTILISYHLHMQDLAMAIVPILLVVDWALRNEITRSKYLRVWIIVLSVAVGGLFAYRVAAEPFKVLLFRSCFLVVPVFLLWIVAFRAFCENRAHPQAA